MQVEFSSLRTDRLRSVHQRIAAQPNWVVRAAIMTFAIIVVLPIFLLVAVAFLFAMFVMLILGLLNQLGGLLGGRSGSLFRRDDGQGRRNVTILPRQN